MIIKMTFAGLGLVGDAFSERIELGLHRTRPMSLRTEIDRRKIGWNNHADRNLSRQVRSERFHRVHEEKFMAVQKMRASLGFVSAVVAFSLGVGSPGVGSRADAVPADTVDFHIVDASTDGHPTFPTFSGPAAVGSAGDYWNAYAQSSGNISASNLADVNSKTTGVGLSVNFPEGGGGSFYDPFNTNNGLMSQYAVGVLGSSDSWSGTITGLIPGDTYSLYLYGNNGRGSAGTNWTIGATTESTNGGSVNPSTTPFYQPGLDYALFSVAADGGGDIHFSATTNGCCATPILNGFQLVGTVPEPGSLSLLAFGAVALILRRRHA